MVVANIPILNEVRPAELLETRFNLPTWLINDAAAGGLAEWHAARHELIYWVLGGGWGGTWINSLGRQQIPSLGWSGRLEDLNCVNEPGFALPLYKSELEPILLRLGLRWKMLDARLPGSSKGCDPELGEWARAEAVTASCGGMRRLFQVFLDGAGARTRVIGNGYEFNESNCETLIGRLAEEGFEPAIKTETFFAEAWALAVDRYFEAASRHGMRQGVPIHLAGGLSHMSDRFLPEVKKHLVSRGVTSRLCISRCHARGDNANLLGAAQLAIRNLAETATEK